MLLQEKLHLIISLNFKPLNVITNTLHTCSCDKDKLLSPNSQRQLQTYKLKTCLLTILIGLTWCQILYDWDSTSGPNRVISLFLTGALSAQLIVVIELYRKRNEISDLFNGFLAFENKYITCHTPNSKFQSIRVKLYSLMPVFCAQFITYAMSLLLFVKPCIPANFGHRLLPECNHTFFGQDVLSSLSFVLKCVLSALNTWLFLFSVTNTGIEYGIYSTMNSYCLLSYLRLLER